MANQPGKVKHILQDIIRLIEAGEWGRAGIMPTREDLKKRYNTSTATINDVFVFLHALGYVRARGRNVIVNPSRIVLPALVPSFDSYLEQLHITPYMENVGRPEEVTLSLELSKAFQLPPNTQAIVRTRVQGEVNEGEKIPFRITHTYYLEALARPYLATIRSNPRFNVTQALKEATGLAIVKSRMHFEVRFPTDEEQKLLQITQLTPVIELFRVSSASDGTVVMFSRIVLISYKFTMSIEDWNTPL